MSNEINREILSDASPEDSDCRVYGDFKNQSKKISQIIAKSWLANDPEGMEIKRVIIRRNSDEMKQLLKKYGVDLERFFGPMKVVVDWNSYKGIITEDVGEAIYILPYPPRPAEVQDEHLEEWINNNDPNTLYPTTPYIPLSAC
ncbi:MAG: hypothetical protein PUP92_29795 [Rhizonema sp. PD38]|nr:hypothetical protein [Rhizonema sp. PD38]